MQYNTRITIRRLYIMTLTEQQMADRLALIKQIAARKQRIAKIVAKGKNVQRYADEEYTAPKRVNLTEKYDGGDSEIHYTDASKYAKEYYGEVAYQTTRFDNDWD